MRQRTYLTLEEAMCLLIALFVLVWLVAPAATVTLRSRAPQPKHFVVFVQGPDGQWVVETQDPQRITRR